MRRVKFTTALQMDEKTPEMRLKLPPKQRRGKR
jgi:hypothetical protein